MGTPNKEGTTTQEKRRKRHQWASGVIFDHVRKHSYTTLELLMQDGVCLNIKEINNLKPED